MVTLGAKPFSLQYAKMQELGLTKESKLKKLEAAARLRLLNGGKDPPSTKVSVLSIRA